MMPCISHEQKDFGESLKTRRYADQVKLLKKAVVSESGYKIERSDVSRRRLINVNRLN